MRVRKGALYINTIDLDHILGAMEQDKGTPPSKLFLDSLRSELVLAGIEDEFMEITILGPRRSEQAKKSNHGIKDCQLEIIEHYGLDNQLERLVEECGELIVAISKNKRYCETGTSVEHHENVIEELADVKNLIEQLEEFDDYIKKGIEVMIGSKVYRELMRIGEENNEII